MEEEHNSQQPRASEAIHGNGPLVHQQDELPAKEGANSMENGASTAILQPSELVQGQSNSADKFQTPPVLPSPVPTTVTITHRQSPTIRRLTGFKKSEDKTEKAFESGFDSDNEIGPFYDAVQYEIELEEDSEFPPDNTDTTVTTEPSQEVSINTTAVEETEPKEPQNEEPCHVPIPDAVLDKMKLTEIVVELKARRQPFYGSKAVRLQRLKDALAKKLPKYREGSKRTAKRKAAMTKKKKVISTAHFPPTVYWRELQPTANPVTEPTNPTFKNPRAPTIPREFADYTPIKHNFTETFDIPVFAGKKEQQEYTRLGAKRKDKDGTLMKTVTTRDEGCPKPSFLDRHGLSKHSEPYEFMEAFFPLHEVKGVKDLVSFEHLMRWTNLKAALLDAGPDGRLYKDWRSFSAREIRQHFGLYIFHGLSPSPRIEMKFKPSQLDPVNGNDFIYSSFGPGAERRHRHFKTFLACQDPRKIPPERTVKPNWKVQPLLNWMNSLFPTVWLLGPSLSVDEMTMGFQGRHPDKKRITYKTAGDGFQADAICDEGFTYQVYMRNDPAPKHYLDQGFSPLHSRTLALFDTLEDDYHRVGMDNLYNSTSLCRAAFNHPRKVLCHGVTRKGGRGLPPCVVQEEVKNVKDAHYNARGTVKAAVLEGDPKCPNLIASSVYDTKPVHYLSMVSSKVEWIEVTKPIFNVDTGRREDFRFLRMNMIHKYNNEMGGVDIADQLRQSYHVQTWLRNRKWWWSIMFWSIGVHLTNAYLVYKTVCKDEGVADNEIMSQYEFRKSIALYWINPDGVEYGLHSQSRKRKLDLLSPSTLSSITAQSTLSSATTSNERAARVTDASLGPNGKLKCRLNTTLNHYPLRPKASSPKCALHRWAKSQTAAQCLLCPTCSIHLCVDCYQPFHTETDLISKFSRPSLS